MQTDIPSVIRAFFAEAQIPLTLSNATVPEDPIILANEPFYRMTGYSADETLGNNCRFMQGKDTPQSALNTIRGDFTARRDTQVLLRNYRKSGEAFDNYLYIFRSTTTPDRPRSDSAPNSMYRKRNAQKRSRNTRPNCTRLSNWSITAGWWRAVT